MREFDAFRDVIKKKGKYRMQERGQASSKQLGENGVLCASDAKDIMRKDGMKIQKQRKNSNLQILKNNEYGLQRNKNDDMHHKWES